VPPLGQMPRTVGSQTINMELSHATRATWSKHAMRITVHLGIVGNRPQHKDDRFGSLVWSKKSLWMHKTFSKRDGVWRSVRIWSIKLLQSKIRIFIDETIDLFYIRTTFNQILMFLLLLLLILCKSSLVKELFFKFSCPEFTHTFLSFLVQ
jgi:hypothetical protein